MKPIGPNRWLSSLKFIWTDKFYMGCLTIVGDLYPVVTVHQIGLEILFFFLVQSINLIFVFRTRDSHM
jgi:hypothetical protein